MFFIKQEIALHFLFNKTHWGDRRGAGKEDFEVNITPDEAVEIENSDIVEIEDIEPENAAMEIPETSASSVPITFIRGEILNADAIPVTMETLAAENAVTMSLEEKAVCWDNPKPLKVSGIFLTSLCLGDQTPCLLVQNNAVPLL